MSKYDMTDKYGAIVLLKGMIEACDTSKVPEFMKKPNELVTEKLVGVINELQADICKEFTGSIMGLAEQIKENEDE